MSSTSVNPYPAEPRRRTAMAGDVALYALLAVLTLATWRISRLGWFTAGDDLGYWLGVAGGTMMLLLFSYPLRKYMRFMHRWGAVKWWFWVHMTLGVGGPLLILLHSTFRIGSLNAGVALISMIIVALSGVAGRFIYVRVHRGLHGERSSLEELRVKAGFDQQEVRSRLHFAPAVEARLRGFEERELQAAPGWATWLRQVFVLPLQQWRTQAVCARELHAALNQVRERSAGDGRVRDITSQRRAERHARRLVRQYLLSVVRVAQFTAYERLFALWHVLHVPFVYLLVISAVVHVVAVHAY